MNAPFSEHRRMTLPCDNLALELNYQPRLPRHPQVGIGCIGAGFIMADCHLVAYRAAGFNPVAIASRRPERAREVAERHAIAKCYDSYRELLADPRVEVVDIAVPPDLLLEVMREVVQHAAHVRGVLAQKPLGMNYAQAREIVALCQSAGIVLAVNQNMRYDQSVRGCKSLIDRGELGEPILATVDMRAIPHWMPWQERLGWLTLRIMSIHHLDAFRFWFGNPQRVFASVRSDPRTTKQFAHEDGICLYILEYAGGLRAAAWDDVWTGPAREGAAEAPRTPLDPTAVGRGLVSGRLRGPDGRIALGARGRQRAGTEWPRQFANDGTGRRLLPLGGRASSRRAGGDLGLIVHLGLTLLDSTALARRQWHPSGPIPQRLLN